jgi:hypothetical protein
MDIKKVSEIRQKVEKFIPPAQDKSGEQFWFYEMHGISWPIGGFQSSHRLTGCDTVWSGKSVETSLQSYCSIISFIYPD